MEPKKRSRDRIALDGATVAVFLAAVGLPLYGFFFRDPGPLDENRERYVPPRITADRYVHSEFTKHFEMYLGDHIGFRDVLLGWHRRIVFKYLDEPVTDRAWIGRDGWYYLNQSDPYRGNPSKPSVAARGDAWVEAFIERDAWFRSRGIEYIVLFAPDKAAVYPEYLPAQRRRHPPPEIATPVAEKLAARGVKCVNLLPAIRAEKERQPELQYYYKTDSHWTPEAARAAYGEIAAAVRERFPDFRPHPLSDYTFRETPGGDLRKLAGIRDDEPMETVRTYEPRVPIDYRVTDEYFSAEQRGEQLDKSQSLVSAQPEASGPPMLFLNDSFGAFLQPFLFSDFKSVWCIS